MVFFSIERYFPLYIDHGLDLKGFLKIVGAYPDDFYTMLI